MRFKICCSYRGSTNPQPHYPIASTECYSSFAGFSSPHGHPPIHQENSCAAVVGAPNHGKLLSLPVTAAGDRDTAFGVSGDHLSVFLCWRSGGTSHCAMKLSLVPPVVEASLKAKLAPLSNAVFAFMCLS